MAWRSFDLHPEYPPEGIPRAELDRRYGGEAWRERLGSMFAEAGLPYSRELDKVPSSRKALAVSELARERGAFPSLHRRLFDAYWARGEDIGDEEVLRREAVAAGLDGEEVVEAARSDARLEPVERSTRRAQEIGVSGVPAWLVDDRLLVPGAQPHELFARVMERLGHEPVRGTAG